MYKRTNSIELDNSIVKIERDLPVVCVRNAFKSYGPKGKLHHVLENFNMTVQKGSIYGLLGASGCGKTTLLSCIVGRKKLSGGKMIVLGGKPGDKKSGIPGKKVGYMPQELALYVEFSIRETVLYFGWIYGMDNTEIDRRLKFLMNFLDLPDENRKIKHLSGGQQRRVSLAAALLHDPELLILDEPTVGVDPVLRKNIWNYLVEISKDKRKTVIITTHYIEEVRQAQEVGIMRGGKLLAEEPPQVLLLRYDCQNLEEVFVKLSRKQEEKCETASSSTSRHDTLKMKEEIKVGCENFEKIELVPLKKRMRALLFKNFLSLWRSTAMMLFVFLLPILQVSFFCMAIGKDPKSLQLAVFNEEINIRKESCSFRQGCHLEKLSCRFLSHLDQDRFPLDYYPDFDSGLNSVKDGKNWALLHFPKNFSRDFVTRTIFKRVDDAILEGSEISVYPDLSNYQIGMSMQFNLQRSYLEFTRELAKDCKNNPDRANPFLSFKNPIVGEENPTFTDFMAPGIILTIIYFLSMGLTALTLISERTEGLLDRSWIAGVTPFDLLLSHLITQLVITILQTILVLIVMITFYGVENNGFTPWLLSLTILQGLCGMCFGFFISALCQKESTAIQFAVGSFYPNLLLSGVVWPIEGMMWLLKPLVIFLPLTLATNSMRNMMGRGWGLLETDVYVGFLSTKVWIAIFLAASLIAVRIKNF